MKLHKEISNNASFKSHPFIQLLLERLAIVEALASKKYRTNYTFPADTKHPVPKNISQLCEQKALDEEKKETINNVFAQIMVLSGLIQDACLEKWKGKTEKAVLNYGLKSAQATLDDETITNDTLNSKIQKYVVTFNERLIDGFFQRSDQPIQLEFLQSTLLKCFPNIDQSKLQNCVVAIENEVANLTFSYVIIDSSSNFFNHSVVPKQPVFEEQAEQNSTCIIS